MSGLLFGEQVPPSTNTVLSYPNYLRYSTILKEPTTLFVLESQHRVNLDTYRFPFFPLLF